MNDSHLFFDAFVYLLAAAVAVPIARRLGLGSVLGYLLAGVLIGPFVFRLIGDPKQVMHFAEFGVVMMLFIIGLELRPGILWELRSSIFGMGAGQLLLTTMAIGAIAMACGLSWEAGLAVGLFLAMSSTAIVLQSLKEKGLTHTPGGEASFAILLFQDIAVIPILALLPLLGDSAMTDGETPASAVAQLPGWLRAIIILAAVAAIVLAGRWLLRYFFRFVAAARVREVFTATALLLIISIVLLMQFVGLSPALGAFIAGVVLAESEYRHQLEADIEPFKGLLLGLFFLTVGAGIDLGFIGRSPVVIGLLTIGLVVLKSIVLLCVGRAFALPPGERSLLACGLAQGGEFAFVLFSIAVQERVLDASISAPLTAAVALSMATTPLLLLLHEKWIMPRLAAPPTRRADKIEPQQSDVLLAGFGRFGHIVGRLLRANGFHVTVLDNDAEQVDTLRKFGLESFYGDAGRLDLLRTAGIENARLFILAIDNEQKSLEIVDMLKKEYPALPILARAASRQHAYELIRRGISQVYRETLGSALDIAVDGLRALGVERERAERAARIFKKHDEASVREASMLAESDPEYISRARHHVENLERALRSDLEQANDAAAERH